MESSFIQCVLYSYVTLPFSGQDDHMWFIACKIFYSFVRLPHGPSLISVLLSQTMPQSVLSFSYLPFLYPVDFPLCTSYSTFSQRSLFLLISSSWVSTIFVSDSMIFSNGSPQVWGLGLTIQPAAEEEEVLTHGEGCDGRMSTMAK